MKSFGSPIPAWLTPAVEMTMKKMAQESPASFVALAKRPDFKEVLQSRTEVLLGQYQSRVESLASGGMDPINAHYLVTEEIWGESTSAARS